MKDNKNITKIITSKKFIDSCKSDILICEKCGNKFSNPPDVLHFDGTFCKDCS